MLTFHLKLLAQALGLTALCCALCGAVVGIVYVLSILPGWMTLVLLLLFFTALFYWVLHGMQKTKQLRKQQRNYW